jgi:YD repeat-containing protein
MIKKILCAQWIVFLIFPLMSYADTVPPIIGAPYYSHDGVVSANSPDEVIDIWWGGYNTDAYLGKYGIRVGECGITVTILNTDTWVRGFGFTGPCQGGGGVRGTLRCPLGYNLIAGTCQGFYDLAIFQNTTPKPDLCTGNPIVISSGTKIQTETDVLARGAGQVLFERFYSSVKMQDEFYWLHTYSKKIDVLDPTKTGLKARSNRNYDTREKACLGGWEELESSILEDWSESATVAYKNGTCRIVKNDVVVRMLPVLRNHEPAGSVQPGSVNMYRPNGAVISFQFDGNSFLHMNGDLGILQMVGTNILRWRYLATNGDTEEYNENGKLISITAPNGIKQILSYDITSGLLSQVQDSMGRKLLFSYVGNKLSSVTTDDGNTTSYSYNPVGLIQGVTRSDGTQRLYHYEDSRFLTALTGITDERGVRYATWAYDELGRAISSEHAGGAERTQISFNADGSSTVTNALGKQTIYRFNYITGARRVVKVEGQPTANCIGANQNYTYTPEGWVDSQTDWKGNKTTYTYNGKGQEISRTEAFGSTVAKTILTEWHTTLNLKTKVTEPDKETIYSYDANGLLISQKTRSLIAQ